MIQVGGYRPGDGDRLRGAQALRAAPDDRRHARDRRDHARAAHDPGAARHLPRHGGALPGRAAAPLRQPDGDELLGGRARRARSARSGSATACRAPPASSPATSACRPARSTTAAPASTTWRSILELRAPRARTSIPRCAARRDAAGARTASATRCSALRLLRAPSPPSTSPSTCRGSSRTAAPDLIERFNIPLDEYPRRCEARSPSGRRCARRSSGDALGRPRSARVRRRHHPRAARPASRSRSTATCH